MYFKNVGKKNEPRFTRAPMPRTGEFPTGYIVRPSPVDWNNDGLLDIVATTVRGNVYLFLNEGTKTQPKWRIDDKELTTTWGFVRNMNLTAWPANVTGDARPEFLNQTVFFSVSGSPYSPQVETLGKATVNGGPIHHAGPGYGDPYAFTYPHDWNGDGRPDLLWGTQQGNVYLHRARAGSADGKTFEFDEGVMLTQTDGQPIKVGPPVVKTREEATDFIILQGSRIRMLVTDYDGDKIDDLLVTETYGNVFLYRNTKAGGTDTLAPPVLLTKLPNRTYSLNAIDWNHDGKQDLLIQGNAAEPIRVAMNETRDGKPALAAPSAPFKLPYMFWNTRYGTTDWNGDGDRDLLACGDFFTFFVEQSFLEHGYRDAELRSVGTAPPR